MVFSFLSIEFLRFIKKLFVCLRAVFYECLFNQEILVFLVAGVAGTRPVGPFPDIVRRRVPIIGQGIEIFHLNARFFECIPDCGNYPQRGYRLPISRIKPQYEVRFGFGAFAGVAVITISVRSGGMAGMAAQRVLVRAVRSF